jgi:radical SAM superfamily enzyme YgiQ (UPF0313 family)
MARYIGIRNLNLDAMFGLPNQTEKDYLDTLAAFRDLGAEHISAYSLILEEGTALHRMVEEGSVLLPDEDDTAAMEMLAFSNTLNQYGSYIRENEPVVISGRLSMRDDKDPQIVINRIRAMSDFASGGMVHEPVVPESVLYLRLPSEEGKIFPKVRAILNMFPGENSAVVYFADTKQRRGTRCAILDSMLEELKNVLGEANVVLK